MPWDLQINLVLLGAAGRARRYFPRRLFPGQKIQKRLGQRRVEKTPKALCSTNRLSAFGDFALFHLPAIIITLVVSALNLKELQWPYSHPTSEELNALQFAAKAHESLIVMSLGDILLQRISYGLLSNDVGGVSLGFLSSPFYLSSPVPYLFSWEFWGTILGPVANRRFHRVTSGLIIILILIGVASNPLSAILMIPRLGWWERQETNLGWSFKHGFHFVDTKDPYLMYLEGSIPHFYSDMADIASYADADNYRDQRIRPMIEATFSDPWQTDGDLLNIAPRFVNVSISRLPTSLPERPISYSVYNSSTFVPSFLDEGNPLSIVATAPKVFVSYWLGESMTINRDELNLLIRSRPSPSSSLKAWKQPVVAVSCSVENEVDLQKDEWVEFDFYDSFHGNFTTKLSTKTDLAFLSNTSLDEAEPAYLDIHNKIPARISAAMLFVDNANGTRVRPLERGPHFRLCLVQARWVEANVWITSDSLPAVQTDIAIPKDLFEGWPPYLVDVIQMNATWLADIGNATKPWDVEPRNSTYRQALDICNSEPLAQPASCISTFLAVYLTDALSLLHTATYSDIFPGDDATIIEQTIYSYRYAYSSHNSKTIILALTVLLLHVVIAISHGAIILLSPRPWTSSGWRGFGQLLALALGSRAIEGMGNVGDGTSGPQLWNELLAVKENADEQRLEIVAGARSRKTLNIEGEVD
ncbi:hypothetical protein MRS44_011148 [Fusarium solani]|uniref:Uncharacterized protein n=1 Tax=Fusarium solani TaxID=169388 RepID=A0A9P9R7E1_FUSSL|nr:uncharacterized protein B0J15DRAFT_578803 [Fusarium solani]KAH7268582.1 hypothetical protein B0J15DRAFT_578803 [Fusarium solani]KAJ3460281.1 hypothetical protein MRS44_011148 [Fusarium solani]